MKKLCICAIILFAGSVIAITACSSSGKLGGMVEGESYNTEGWIDDNTIRVVGAGIPMKDSTNPVQRKKTAIKAAQLDATYTIIEKFCGSKVEGAAGMKNYELTGIAVSQELKATLKTGTVKKVTCDEDQNCEVIYEVTSPGLKKKMKLDCK